MKIAVGILTRNLVSNKRKVLFTECMCSLLNGHGHHEPYEFYVLNNGSTDGSYDFLLDVVPAWACLEDVWFEDGIHTVGRGRNKIIEHLKRTEPDIVVLSDDDMLWVPDWGDQVRRFWREAPGDLLICSGMLSPEFPWNSPIQERIECGGVPALVRPSATGGAWTFRGRDIDTIGEIQYWPPAFDDVPKCKELVAKGYRVAEADWADHKGMVSTWGNNAWADAPSFDRARWNVVRGSSSNGGGS